MSFFTQSEQFMVADTSGLDCGSFKAGLGLRYLEDEDLVEATDRAVAKAKGACAREKRARLRTRDGTAIAVPCPEGGLPDASLFLQLKASEVAAVLVRPGVGTR
jgi:hypothetical protein